MINNTLGLMCGIDLPVQECKLIIHQPKIKEIAFIGEKEFFQGVQYLCLDKESILQKENELPIENISNFQLFIKIMNDKEALDKKENVLLVCDLLFPQYKITFTPFSMIFLQDQEAIIIDENNFKYLQKIISEICCLKSGEKQDFNPGDEKAKEIAEKLMRGRQRVAAQKNPNQENISVYSQYLSILAIGMNSMPLQELINLTIFQMFDLIERYKLYLNWDLDIRSRLAGGKPDSAPEDCMKNIH